MTHLTLKEHEEQYNKELNQAWEEFCRENNRKTNDNWEDFFECHPHFEPQEDDDVEIH
jgi:hypothetical protein